MTFDEMVHALRTKGYVDLPSASFVQAEVGDGVIEYRMYVHWPDKNRPDEYGPVYTMDEFHSLRDSVLLPIGEMARKALQTVREGDLVRSV